MSNVTVALTAPPVTVGAVWKYWAKYGIEVVALGGVTTVCDSNTIGLELLSRMRTPIPAA